MANIFQRKIINGGCIGFICAIAAFLLVFSEDSSRALEISLQEQIVGTWALVSTRTTRSDGTVYGPYGPHETGTLIFERNDRFALILIDPDTPKFASNNREEPTPEEATAAAKGGFAFFGSYSLNEADKTFVFHVEASNFPNFNGTNQKRLVESISASELIFVNFTPPNGGAKVRLIFRRLN
jgi:hypothetical protein